MSYFKEYTEYKKSIRPIILKEAEQAFLNNGIRAVKMDDIAHTLGISKRTLYELYATKEDLLVEVVEHKIKEQDERFRELYHNSKDTMELLIGIMKMKMETAATTHFRFFKDIIKYPKIAQIINHKNNNHLESAMRFYTKGVEEGYFLPNINYSVFNMISDGVYNMLCSDDRYSSLTYKDLIQNHLYIMMRGICTPKGIEHIDNFMESVE